MRSVTEGELILAGLDAAANAENAILDRALNSVACASALRAENADLVLEMRRGLDMLTARRASFEAERDKMIAAIGSMFSKLNGSTQ